MGAAQGLVWSAGLPAVVWWVVELRFPPLRLALLGTALVLTILVAEAPTGVLADLYGRRLSVVASFAVMGAATGLMAASPAFGALILWQAVWALGWTMQSGATTAWVTDELLAGPVPSTDAAAASGVSAGDSPAGSPEVPGGTPGVGGLDQLIVRHATWRAIGVMVGLALAAGVGTWSLRGALVVVGALSLAFAVYLAVAMTETGFIRGSLRGIRRLPPRRPARPPVRPAIRQSTRRSPRRSARRTARPRPGP